MQYSNGVSPLVILASASDGLSSDIVGLVAAATGVLASLGGAALGVNLRRVAVRRLRSAEKTALIVHDISESNSVGMPGRDGDGTSLEPSSTSSEGRGSWEPITSPQDSSARFIESIGQAAARTSAAQADLYVEHHKRALALHSQYQQAALYVGIFGFLVILLGAVLSYIAGLDVGILTASSGAIAEGAAALLFKQADKVDTRATDLSNKLYRSVERSEALRQTLSVAAMVTDEQARNRIYTTIALQGAISESTTVELAATDPTAGGIDVSAE